MKKKGFTLIELLAVIVILAIIALIIVPTISNVIDSARKAAFRESVGGVIDSTASYIHRHILKYHDELNEYPVVFTCDGESCKTTNNDVLTFKGNVPKSGRIIIQDGGVLAEYITDGKYCAYGYKWDLIVEDSCGKADATKPTLSATLNGQKINITMSDNESGIYGYCVTKDDNCNYISTNETYVEHELNEHGTYKVYAKDKKGNISEYQEIVVPLENFKPSISSSMNEKVVTLTFTLKTEADSYCINTSDTTEGCNWISVTGTSVEHELEAAGTYYAFVKDKKNYISDSTTFEASSDAFCAYQPNEVIQSPSYTGGVQTYTILETGWYRFTVKGSKGGNSSNGRAGGAGGISTGEKYLTKGTVLYIVVGGQNGYNGGGGSTACRAQWGDTTYGGNGGGATHIATALRGNGTLANYNSYRSEVLIVAGGGGGAGGNNSGSTPGVGNTSSSLYQFGQGQTPIQHTWSDNNNGKVSHGGGGGGWFGGTAPTSSADWAGNGGYGGQGYVTGLRNGSMTAGGNNANGSAEIIYLGSD